MAVTSPGGRDEECSFVTSIIGTNIQLKYLVKNRTKNRCSNDQVRPYKCLSRASDELGTLDVMEEVWPSSLSMKFSNGTSIVDINDRCSDDFDLYNEAKIHLPKVLTTFFEQYGLISH
ncbi:hypothetical protein Adt_11348 [Abeliophyllum distichum]|uniref:Uncharacterized protein n=1 Tax=Abeliophyllum distichum TaxID=126358 RepID=A0ABD1UMM0_9LAMI